MERGYDHVEWTTPRLLHRLGQIAHHLDTVKLGTDRIRQLDHEADCIAFEVGKRSIPESMGQLALDNM